MKAISDLRIGQIDAQWYLQNPNDPLTAFFEKSFHKSTHLEALLNPNTYFYVGEKGTGKTAYIVYTKLFLQENHSSEIVIFSSDNFSRFAEVSEQLSLSRPQYPSLWSFVFTILLTQASVRKFGAGDDQQFSAFLTCVDTATFSEGVNTIQDALELANGVDDLFMAFVKSTKISTEANARNAKTYFKLEKLAAVCLKYLSTLGPGCQLSIFIDSLDVRPNSLDFPLYLSVTSAVASAVHLINNTQLAKLPSYLKLVLLLRPDVFEAIQLQNKNAVLAMHTHLIEWTTTYKNFRRSDLFAFTDRLLSSQQTDSLPVGQAWAEYFPFSVKSRREGVGDDDPFIILLRHSFYKPRDIVQYLKLMQAEYVARGLGSKESFGSEVFVPRDASPELRDVSREIQRLYRRYVLGEIEDQTRFYYSQAEWQQFKDFNDGYLSTKIDKRGLTFDYDSFVDAHSKFLHFSEKNGLELAPSFRTADSLLQFMFDLNVIGYYATRELAGGQTRFFTNYSFRQRSLANLKPKLPVGSDHRYVMHYGVARALFTDLQ